jgi:endonuclease/exonuclease/phosphatase family metal-dependent hydrolase
MCCLSKRLDKARRPMCLIPLALVLLLSGCQSRSAFDIGNRPEFMQEPSRPHIRVLTYNVGWDSIFQKAGLLDDLLHSDSRADAFVRIVRAVDPDVICLQEIDPARDPSQVAHILDAAIPLDDGKNWQATGGQDNVIVTRYGLTMRDQQVAYHSDVIDLGHAMALVDLPDALFPNDLYLICAHFMALGGQENVAARQRHADMIVSWIRDMQTPGGDVDLPSNTPFVVLGDLNVYYTDPAHHLATLLTGDIVDEGTYGPDIAPDWDGTDLADALPSHNADGTELYTWRDDTSQFKPEVLDRILYTDSVLAAPGGFVLDTTVMAPADLEAADLRPDDVMLKPDEGIFDHLPLVLDLEFVNNEQEDQ